MSDLRYALRALRKAPALAAIAIVSLALGIGANVTVCSVAREMILDDVTASDPARLARVDLALTYAQYRDLRAAGIFADTAFDTGLHDALWQRSNRNEVVWGMDTSPNFFDLLGVSPSAGRLYRQSDEGQPVAVVSYGFWSRRLHAAPGATLQINGRVYTVVGVLPRDYRSVMGHAVAPEIYAPARLDSQQRCHPFGRLRDGMTRDQLRQALAATPFGRDFAAVRPFSGLAANALANGDSYRVFVFFAMLTGVAAMLAAIACANVAGLLVARRLSRERELTIRHALGASPWQLARPMICEATVLVACAAGLGLALDACLRANLRYLRWPTAYNIPLEFHFESAPGLWAYALVTAFAALLVCSARWKPRGGFVGLQMALSMLLLTLGALFTRSFLHVVWSGVGFDATHTLIAAVHPPPRAPHGWEWRERLADAIRRVPGVESVTSTDLLPLMGEVPTAPIRRDTDPPSAARDVYSMAEGERYFATLRIPILRGRDFTTGDRDRSPTPAIVNRSFARQFFGDTDPIGAHLIRGREKQDVLEIIGIAADSKMRTLGEAPAPAFYTPDYNGQFLVRVAGNPAQWIAPLRRALASADPVPALDVRPLRDAVAGALFPMQAAAALVGSLAGLGLILALTGLYGSVSYAVSRRTREMGIRSALGATRARLLSTVLRPTALLLAAGAIVGLTAALAAIRPLADLLPDGVDPWDPRLFAVTAALLIATGLAAAAIPARRAATIDPAAALREGR